MQSEANSICSSPKKKHWANLAPFLSLEVEKSLCCVINVQSRCLAAWQENLAPAVQGQLEEILLFSPVKMLVALCCTLWRDIDIWASKPMYSEWKGLVTVSKPMYSQCKGLVTVSSLCTRGGSRLLKRGGHKLQVNFWP